MSAHPQPRQARPQPPSVLQPQPAGLPGSGNGNGHFAGDDTEPGPLAPLSPVAAAPASRSSELQPLSDSQAWIARLQAMQQLLRRHAAESRAVGEPEAARRRQADLHYCMQSLDLFQQAIGQQVHLGQHLQAQLQQARAALQQSRQDLLSLQLGERQERHLALHDPLTALPNRRFFSERLEHALAHLDPQQGRLALLYLDLDEFKAVNDLHGHAIGDELLRIVATRLLRSVRSEDMVSRIGGDEFACLRLDSGCDPPQLARMAQTLCERVAAPLRIGALIFHARLSIGIALCPEHGRSAANLLRAADAAMYRAKRSGSGHAFYEGPVLGA